MSKFSFDKPNDSSIDEVLENLINKLKSSNNGYVHGAIGNHYLFNKKVCICTGTYLLFTCYKDQGWLNLLVV